MKLNIHYYQHVNYEGLAALRKWCDSSGHNLSKTNFKNDEPIPNPDMYDALIILGGPMSVTDEAKYPWLKVEKRSIDRALNDGKKVIGICLGAQMLAEVLGGKVSKSDEPEIGWHKITMTDTAKNINHFNTFPEEFTTFHWHGEEFSLPESCQRIAYSEGCNNQIFTYGELAAGFQCHLEQTEYHIGRMLDRAGNLKAGKYIQTPEQIISDIHYAIKNNELLFNFLYSFLKFE